MPHAYSGDPLHRRLTGFGLEPPVERPDADRRELGDLVQRQLPVRFLLDPAEHRLEVVGQPDGTGRQRRDCLTTKTFGRSVPLFFIVGAISQYLGAAMGVFLFETTEPATVAWFRAAGAAAVLLAWRRPWRSTWTVRTTMVATSFGLVTLAMNVAFYEAIARIPLGTAVAIEFAGLVVVATLGSRRIRRGRVRAGGCRAVGGLHPAG